ncbi:MAG: DUF302 domain-containing protein [Candidatus Korobacteraceae bacterium]
MVTRDVVVQRFSTVSFKPFRDVVEALHLMLGHPDIAALTSSMTAADTYVELEKIVEDAVGSSGFIEFARFDIGAVLRKRNGAPTPHILRFVFGNPITLSQMAKDVPDAASYAPVTVLIQERPDGVRLSYDRMASCLAPYGNMEALQVARELDAKVEAMLMNAARVEVPPLSKTA